MARRPWAPEAAGRFHGREGCVVVPVVERYSPELGGGGRVILKPISADYLARKRGIEEHRGRSECPLTASAVAMGMSSLKERP